MGINGDDDYLKNAYLNYYVKIKDSTTIELRAAGQLGYVNFSFSPGLAHSEGVLHDRSILGGYQDIQDQLSRIFTQPNDQVMGLTV